MRFILMGMATKESETGVMPKPEAFAAMQEYNEDLAKRATFDTNRIPERQCVSSSWAWRRRSRKRA